jgi:hypothetical protein
VIASRRVQPEEALERLGDAKAVGFESIA